MSIEMCPKCDKRVDTDKDDSFYGFDGEGYGNWFGLCESCREELDAQGYEQAMEQQFDRQAVIF